MNLKTLKLSFADSVATISLARPDKLNALNMVMHAELRTVLEHCERDDAVKVVVFTGEGRAFSSGQDLTEDLPRSADGKIDFEPSLLRDYNPLVLSLVNFPKVTVAAVNGPAVGASMNIALACDIVLAARSAYFQEAFANIALIPDAGGTWILPRLVGPKQALALMLTADQVSAEEAHRMGLVYKVFDDAGFARSVATFAGKLAKGPGLAQRLVKQAMAQSLQNDLETQLNVEAKFQSQAGFSEDFLEGVTAFREKRAPKFEGR